MTYIFFYPNIFDNHFYLKIFWIQKYFNLWLFRFSSRFKSPYKFTFESIFKFTFNSTISKNRMPAWRQLVYWRTTHGAYHILLCGIFLITIWKFLKCYCHNPNCTTNQPQLYSTEFGFTWLWLCTPPPTTPPKLKS